MKPRSHFAERCVKYGIVSINGDVLRKRLETDSSFSEHTIRLDTSTLRCFIVDEGAFYALFDDDSGTVKTLYTREMVTRIKRRNKRFKKWRSHQNAKRRH